jgi:hypothetical protein
VGLANPLYWSYLFTFTARISSSVKYENKTDYEYKRDLVLRGVRAAGLVKPIGEFDENEVYLVFNVLDNKSFFQILATLRSQKHKNIISSFSASVLPPGISAETHAYT